MSSKKDSLFVNRLRHCKALCLLLVVSVTVTFSVDTLFAQTGSDKQVSKNQVNKLRLWHSPDKTRVVFDVSADISHKVFRLSAPDRVVIDIENIDLNVALPELDAANQHVQTIRSGQPKPDVLRFVMELKRPLQETSFVLTPNELYGYRLVVDLVDESAAITGADSAGASILLDPSQSGPQTTLPSQASLTRTSEVAILEPAVLKPIELQRPVQGKVTIAIDAGHGGEDPGAIGHRGSYEKKITLQIARRLKDVIDTDPRMQAVLVREGDYYIDLHKRRQMARAKGADIFVSIHADAFKRRSAHGLSVFALSQSGATSAMARALAAKENASDLIGGVSLANKDEVLAKVLVDLSMTNTISESVNLGGRVLRELGQVGKLHSRRVEQAGFAVLKSPDMPSILVETGFITNPDEERKLRSAKYQKKLANAIYAAISQYYDQTPYYSTASYSSPSIGSRGQGSISAKPSKPRYHKVARGDTLSEIAEKYGTTVRQLKKVNKLRTNTAMLGQRLKLPGNARSAQSTTKPGVHVVKRGDSLSRISAKYNVTIRALKSMNKLRSNTLVPGQKLVLSSAATQTGSAAKTLARKPVTHKVRRGDTLSEIAEKYGLTERKIMRANNMRNRTVMLGQTLKIPG